MKKHHMLVIMILVTLTLSACRMSASTPPPVTPTTNLSEIARQATQTAIAKTPKAGDTQVPEATQADDTQAATQAPTEAADTPEPTQKPTSDSDNQSGPEYAVPDSYTLHEGEFPFCLARRFNINIDDLLNHNGLSRDAILYPGDVIEIPRNARPYNGNRARRTHPTTYTVQSGETIYEIACLFGDVDPRAIAEVNDIGLEQSLQPGTVLQIP